MGVPINTAEFIAQFLKENGIRDVLGMPGGEVLTVIDAVRAAGINFHLVHHEATAAFAADVTGQITGQPGVCITTLGPGAANAVAGIASAWGERSPVLILTGDLPLDVRGTSTHQALDLIGMFSPICKWSGELTAENVATVLPQIFAQASLGQRGPVHAVLTPTEAERELPQPPASRAAKRGADSARAEAADPAAVEALVREARRVVVVAGLGLEQARGGAELRQLAEAWQVPVVLTPKAKGEFPEDHRLFAGTYGPYGHAAVERFLAGADLILATGLDGVDLIRPWRLDVPVASLRMPGPPDPTYVAAATVEGDLPAMLQSLARSVAPAARWSLDEIAACRKEIARVLAPDPEIPGLAPQTVLRALRTLLPRDGILTVDAGAHKLLACQQWPAYVPHSFFVPNGLSAMGYALPAAIAAQLVYPRRKVACLTGDGALLMYAGELATLARLGVPVTALVMVDESLSLIEMKQEKLGYPATAVRFRRPDFRALAQSLGLPAVRVTSEAELEPVLGEVLESDRPVLVEVVVNPEQYRRL